MNWAGSNGSGYDCVRFDCAGTDRNCPIRICIHVGKVSSGVRDRGINVQESSWLPFNLYIVDKQISGQLDIEHRGKQLSLPDCHILAGSC
jgi:hypothetical protein